MKRMMSLLLALLGALLLPPVSGTPAEAVTSPAYALQVRPTAWLQANGSAVAVFATVTCPRTAGLVLVDAVLTQAGNRDVHQATNSISRSCTGSPLALTQLVTFGVPLSVPFSPGSAQLLVNLSFSKNRRFLVANRVVTLSAHPISSSVITHLTRAASGAAFVVTAALDCPQGGVVDVIGTASQRIGPSLAQRGILRQSVRCRPPRVAASLYVPAPRRPWTTDAAVVEITSVCPVTCIDIEAIRTFGQPS